MKKSKSGFGFALTSCPHLFLLYGSSDSKAVQVYYIL